MSQRSSEAVASIIRQLDDYNAEDGISEDEIDYTEDQEEYETEQDCSEYSSEEETKLSDDAKEDTSKTKTRQRKFVYGIDKHK